MGIVNIDELKEEPPMNCDIYADVDFGRGPVTVRCTQTGPHTIHKCEVVLMSDVVHKEEPHQKGPNHRNVFESD